MKVENKSQCARRVQFLTLAMWTGAVLISMATATIVCETTLIRGLISEWDTRHQQDDIIPYLWGGLTILMQTILTGMICFYTKRQHRKKGRPLV